MPDYGLTRDRVETYFDRTATQTWERLTSHEKVSRIRETVRKGRDQMRALMLSRLPQDLRGARVLDAGCGTGAMATELAQRGARVTAVDISQKRLDRLARDTNLECLRINLDTEFGRLEAERFAWPATDAGEATCVLTAKELEWLLEGFDLWAGRHIYQQPGCRRSRR